MQFYGNRLKELREENHLKQEEICKIINVERGAYSQYETEYFLIPLKHLITLCDYYNISLDYVFEYSVIERHETSTKGYDKIKCGKRLKEFRKSQNLTQNALADILETSQGVLADYERGRNLISTKILYKLCREFKISADYITGKIEEPKTLKLRY